MSHLFAGTTGNRVRVQLAVCVVAIFVWALLAGTAYGSEGIVSFSTHSSTSQAGGHPDLETTFELESPGEPEAAQNVIFKAPTGVFGNPKAIPRCTSSDFSLDQCPADSQAGLITVFANYGGQEKDLLGTAPVFDLIPATDQPALFAFNVPSLDIPIDIPVAVRTESDFGLTVTVSNITQITPLAAAHLTLWGYPAEEAHNSERFAKGSPGHPAGCVGETGTGCITRPTEPDITVHPLTDNPTTCSESPLTTSLEVTTYEDPETPTRVDGSYPATTGCEKETFNPVLYSSPTSVETDSASGLNIELVDPQFEGFAASPSEIRAANVALPPGLTINPDAADGQTACTDAEANFGKSIPPECPDNAKIGTFALHSVALEETLEGSVYIGQPLPGDQYRLFLTASGLGLNVKIAGSFKPNPETGQITASFDELPQAPFDEFDLHLFAGERALMATPITCTVYKTSGEYFPWDSSLPPVRSSQVFGLSSGPHGSLCPSQIRPFEPVLSAGTSNPTAGAHSSFTLKLNREDGDQFLGKLNFTMPPGLTANLHGITYCSAAAITAAAQRLGKAEQAQPSCPASSEIGTSNVAAGPGVHPFHATGKIYMAGPFQGAPLSLVAITPALAGPYDYGNVVVRVALHVDPLDAHVIADSETVPEIIGGIPIRMREIRVNIDKPNFMINPTNCSPFSVDSEGVGDQGTAVAFSSYFQATNCAALPFAPKMTVTQLGGRKGTARGQDPSLRFDLRTNEGDANIRSLSVTLPNALEIDQKHLANICAKSELERDHCAGRQPIGVVKDETPLLEKPLEGFAYAVSGYTGLPHVVFVLGGQVMVVPQAESKTTSGDRFRTTLPVVPDVPIGHFQLTLYGKGKGYLANTRSLCGKRSVVAIEYHAQNEKSLSQKAPIRTACAVKDKRPERRHH